MAYYIATEENIRCQKCEEVIEKGKPLFWKDYKNEQAIHYGCNENIS